MNVIDIKGWENICGTREYVPNAIEVFVLVGSGIKDKVYKLLTVGSQPHLRLRWATKVPCVCKGAKRPPSKSTALCGSRPSKCRYFCPVKKTYGQNKSTSSLKDMFASTLAKVRPAHNPGSFVTGPSCGPSNHCKSTCDSMLRYIFRKSITGPMAHSKLFSPLAVDLYYYSLDLAQPVILPPHCSFVAEARTSHVSMLIFICSHCPQLFVT